MLGFERRDIRPALNLLSITMRDRYLGSRLGTFWAILNPLLLMCVFVFLFGYIFKIRLPGASTTNAYASWLIGGYAPWIATVEALSCAAASVMGAAALVKNVAFKTELLPVAAVLSSVVSLAVGMSTLMILLSLDGKLGWHALLVVPVMLIHYLMLVSMGLVLATLTVFYRDIVQVLPNLFMVILLTSPILVPLETMPNLMQAVGSLNPFFIICDGYRAALVQQRVPNFSALGVLCVLSLLLLVYGLRLFRRAKGHFEAFL